MRHYLDNFKSIKSIDCRVFNQMLQYIIYATLQTHKYNTAASVKMLQYLNIAALN
jgi:hypothetical protein